MDCLGLLSPESAILSFLFFEPHRIRGTSTLKCVRCAKVISCSSPRFQRWSLLSQWSQQKDVYMIRVRIYRSGVLIARICIIQLQDIHISYTHSSIIVSTII